MLKVSLNAIILLAVFAVPAVSQANSPADLNDLEILKQLAGLGSRERNRTGTPARRRSTREVSVRHARLRRAGAERRQTRRTPLN